MRLCLLVALLFFSPALSQTLVSCPFTQCVSNEVTISLSSLNSASANCRFVGDVISLNLNVTLKNPAATALYDAQIYVGVDAQGMTLNTGTCARFTLTPLSATATGAQVSSGAGPYLSANGDECGDLGARSFVVFKPAPINVMCADNNADGVLDPITTCVAFNQQSATACTVTSGTSCSCSSQSLSVSVPLGASCNGVPSSASGTFNPGTCLNVHSRTGHCNLACPPGFSSVGNTALTCVDGVYCGSAVYAPGFTCAPLTGYLGTCQDTNSCVTDPCAAGFTCVDLPPPATGATGRTCACPGGVAVGGACQVGVTFELNEALTATITSSAPLTFIARFGGVDTPIAVNINTLAINKITVTGPAALPSPTFQVAAGAFPNEWLITVNTGSGATAVNGLYMVSFAVGAGTAANGAQTEVASGHFTLNTLPPTVTISAPGLPSGFTNDINKLIFTITFNKPVDFNDPADPVLAIAQQIAQTLAAAVNVQQLSLFTSWDQPATGFTIQIVPNSPGPITLTIPANVAFDDAGQGNLASAPFTIFWDLTPPTVALSTAFLSTNANPVLVTATFSEPVGSITGATPTSQILAASSGVRSLSITAVGVAPFSVFTLAVVPLVDGASFTVKVPNITLDRARNQNLPSAPLTIFYASNLCAGASNGGCSPNAKCSNATGGRSCTCNAGFTGDGITCQDVDECLVNNGGCAMGAVCHNTIGSFQCFCFPGYVGDGYHFCNTTGNCPFGYFLNETLHGCDDINECSLFNGGCFEGPPLTTCTNTNGSHVCGPCPSGYTGDNTIPSPCIDINECATTLGDCGINSSCSNLPGTFDCCCNQGYIKQEGVCVGCADGFTSNFCSSTTCFDINECATDNGGCQQVCTNISPFRNCGCNPGYHVDTNNPTQCLDDNECATGNGGCDPLTSCINIPGSRLCSQCPTGYSGNGASPCQDVNECGINFGICSVATGGPNCVGCLSPSVGGHCTNSVGSFSCFCGMGYNGDGFTGDAPHSGCTAVNFCGTNNGGCDVHAVCTLSLGPDSGPVCTCGSGYQGNGTFCSVINFCATQNGGCDPFAICTPMIGGRICMCPTEGFIDPVGNGLVCNDINECMTGDGGCAVEAKCNNTPGSFHCDCNSGYEGTGQVCTDINECATVNGACDSRANCTNTPGSRTCACNTGFFGDGVHCTGPDAPTVVVTPNYQPPYWTNMAPVEFRVVFSKTVVGFPAVQNLIHVSNGQAVSTVAVDETSTGAEIDSVFLLSVTPDNDPVSVFVFIPAGITNDYAPHPNVASNTAEAFYTTVFPSPSVTAAAATNTNPIINVDFNRTVDDFGANRAATIKAAGSNIASVEIVPGMDPSLLSTEIRSPRHQSALDAPPNSQYHIVVTPQAQGPVTFTFPANVATDAAGNGNQASMFQLTINYDPSPLVATVTPLNGRAATNTDAVFVITLNKDAQFVDQAYINTNWVGNDAVLTNANSATLVQVSSSQYELHAVPTANLVYVNFTLPANAAKDAAGNVNAAQPTVAILYDTTPVVILSVIPPFLLVTGASAPFDVTFNKPVEFFDKSPNTWMGLIKTATANSFAISATPQPNSAGAFHSVWRVFVTPLDYTATVRLVVPASVARDLATNENSGAESAQSVGFAINAPSMHIVPRRPFTNNPVITVDVWSDKPSNALLFVQDDAVKAYYVDGVIVLNAVLSSVGAPPTSNWTITLTLAPSLTYQVLSFSVPDNAFLVGAGNQALPNRLSGPVTIVLDKISPTAMVFLVDDGGLTLTPTFSVNFSKPVTFPATGISLISMITGAFAAVTQPTNRHFYLVRVTVNDPNTQWVNFTLASGAAVDDAGNPNVAHGVVSDDFLEAQSHNEPVQRSSSSTNKVWIPVGIIIALLVLLLFICLLVWWYNKQKENERKNKAADDEAKGLKENTDESDGRTEQYATRDSVGQGNERKRDDEAVEVPDGTTGGTDDSDEEESLNKPNKRGLEQPVYHIHYQGEESQNASEAGDGAAHSQQHVPESPVSATGPQQQKPLVWL